jgi:hypothetical protein
MEELLWNIKRKSWKIVPKPFQMTPQIDEKSFKLRPGGTPKKRQKTKMKKRGGPFNSVALLGAILEKNGVPRWIQKSIKINKKWYRKVY